MTFKYTIISISGALSLNKTLEHSLQTLQEGMPSRNTPLGVLNLKIRGVSCKMAPPFRPVQPKIRGSRPHVHSDFERPPMLQLPKQLRKPASHRPRALPAMWPINQPKTCNTGTSSCFLGSFKAFASTLHEMSSKSTHFRSVLSGLKRALQQHEPSIVHRLARQSRKGSFGKEANGERASRHRNSSTQPGVVHKHVPQNVVNATNALANARLFGRADF